MSVINKNELRQYLKHEMNVLLIGAHGVGKTAVIKEIFESENLKWRYFSASTMDPWVDFIGLPKITDYDVDGVKNHRLQLIKPDFIQNDEVEAIFMDELNRAQDKKIINAIMELIQFKSINGHRLKNLKVIWGAINPEDEEETYLVNHLDPAHMDRFHVHVEVPYKVDERFFIDKYPKTGQIFIEWWKQLPKDIQKLVSPRRLDYAAEAHQNNLRIEAVLPFKSNPKNLREALRSVPFVEELKKITDASSAEQFLKNGNNATKMLDLVKANDENALVFFKKFAKSLPDEINQVYIDFLNTSKLGADAVDSLSEMVDRLPGDRGTSATAAFINAVRLDAIYKTDDDLFNAIRTLHRQDTQKITKLASRLVDVILSGTKPETLKRCMYTEDLSSTATAKSFSNFAKLLQNVGSIPGILVSKQIDSINDKLYRQGVVTNRTFITLN